MSKYINKSKYTLKIKVLDSCPNRADVLNYYMNKAESLSYKGDSGIDLIFPEDCVIETGKVTMCGLGIACEMIKTSNLEFNDNHPISNVTEPFYLASRSSISKTPLTLANGIGVIDAGYRGEIIAAFRCNYDRSHPSTIDKQQWLVNANDRYVQIIAPDLKPITVELTGSLSQTERGDKGFGSTNQPSV